MNYLEELDKMSAGWQEEVNVTLSLRTLRELIKSVAVWQRMDIVSAVIEATRLQLDGYRGIAETNMSGQ